MPLALQACDESLGPHFGTSLTKVAAAQFTIGLLALDQMMGLRRQVGVGSVRCAAWANQVKAVLRTLLPLRMRPEWRFTARVRGPARTAPGSAGTSGAIPAAGVG